jgi:hypothetical protein
MITPETLLQRAGLNAVATQHWSKLRERLPTQQFPANKLERLRAHRYKPVESKKPTVATGSVAQEQAQPAKAVRSRQLRMAAEPPTGFVPQSG